MSDVREAFENAFPVPSGCFWCEEENRYKAVGDIYSDLRDESDQQCRWEGWQAAQGEAEAVGEVEPMVYGNWNENGGNFKNVVLVDRSLPLGTKVYTHPPAPTGYVDKDKVDKIVATAQAVESRLKDELSRVEEKLEVIYQYQSDSEDRSVWYWQGDGADHIESLCGQCVVAISASELRGLISYAPPTPSVPDGWQLVPIEPTEKMVDVGAIAGGSTPSAYREAIRTYREMLNATPKPQEPKT